MYKYDKLKQYPINIKRKDPKMAKYILTQCGGPYGELGAAIRYLSQRYTMPDERGRTLLSDIASEEFGHVEMICALVHQLTDGCTLKELEDAGLGCKYAQHGKGIFPSDCNGVPFGVDNIGVTGNFIADLSEDMAAEEKARVTYEHLIDLCRDDDVRDVLLFLRQREVVHYNLFKELLEMYKKEYCNKK